MAKELSTPSLVGIVFISLISGGYLIFSTATLIYFLWKAIQAWDESALAEAYRQRGLTFRMQNNAAFTKVNNDYAKLATNKVQKKQLEERSVLLCRRKHQLEEEVKEATQKTQQKTKQEKKQEKQESTQEKTASKEHVPPPMIVPFMPPGHPGAALVRTGDDPTIQTKAKQPVINDSSVVNVGPEQSSENVKQSQRDPSVSFAKVQDCSLALRAVNSEVLVDKPVQSPRKKPKNLMEQSKVSNSSADNTSSTVNLN